MHYIYIISSSSPMAGCGSMVDEDLGPKPVSYTYMSSKPESNHLWGAGLCLTHPSPRQIKADAFQLEVSPWLRTCGRWFHQGWGLAFQNAVNLHTNNSYVVLSPSFKCSYFIERYKVLNPTLLSSFILLLFCWSHSYNWISSYFKKFLFVSVRCFRYFCFYYILFCTFYLCYKVKLVARVTGSVWTCSTCSFLRTTSSLVFL